MRTRFLFFKTITLQEFSWQYHGYCYNRSSLNLNEKKHEDIPK